MVGQLKGLKGWRTSVNGNYKSWEKKKLIAFKQKRIFLYDNRLEVLELTDNKQFNPMLISDDAQKYMWFFIINFLIFIIK